MSQISRLKDSEISNGNLINADDIDAELNQLVAESNSQDTRLGSLESSAMTIGGVKTFTAAPKMDQIDERTTASGVTIDGVLHKDGAIRVPGSAGFTPSTNGDLGYDATSHSYDVYVNGSAKSLLHTGSNINDLNDVTITTPASGQALVYNGSGWVNGVSGALVLLASATASSSSSVDFTSYIDATYDKYIINIVNLKPATDNAYLWMRVSEDGGSTWKAGASDYKYAAVGRHSNNGVDNDNSNGDSKIRLNSPNAISGVDTTDGNNSLSGTVEIFGPSTSGVYKMFHFETQNHQTYLVVGNGSGIYVGSGNAINGIRFLMDTGNIASGKFYLYGVRKS